MSIDKVKAAALAERLLRARIRILREYGFFGLLLMHVTFAVDENCKTASTDGKRISFGPKFADKLSDWELDFVLLHEILHIALRHCFRGEHFDPVAFNIACDIVVNSNIMKAMGRNVPVVLTHYGEAMHLTPYGKPGHEYTAEEVYEMLPKKDRRLTSGDGDGGDGNSDSNSDSGSDKGDGKGGGSGRGQGGIGDGPLFCDEHDQWGTLDPDDAEQLQEEWDQRILNAAEAVEIQTNAACRGDYSKELIERLLHRDHPKFCVNLNHGVK